jgi:cytochrome P450
MGDFVACLSPLSSADQLTAASTSAQALLDRLGALVAQSQPQAGQLLRSVLAHAGTCGWQDQRAVLCNLVGLMSQTYEATAGLIGNTWVALIQRPVLLDALIAEGKNASKLAARVHTLVLLLGSANRDTQGRPLASELQLQSAPPPYFSFGRGVHACPGRALALTLAASAITQLLLSHQGPPMQNLAGLQVSYRPSVNARIPLFSAAQ